MTRRLTLCALAMASAASGLLAPAPAYGYQYYSIMLIANRPGVPVLSVSVPPGSSGVLGAPAVLAQPFNANPSTRQPFELEWRQQWRLLCGNGPTAFSFAGPSTARVYGCRYINRATGKCLDIKGPSSANRTVVHQWNCIFRQLPYTPQWWNFTGNRLLNVWATYDVHINRCLDVTNFSARIDTRLQIYACSPGWNQNFQLRKADPPEPTGRSSIP